MGQFSCAAPLPELPEPPVPVGGAPLLVPLDLERVGWGLSGSSGPPVPDGGRDEPPRDHTSDVLENPRVQPLCNARKVESGDEDEAVTK